MSGIIFFIQVAEPRHAKVDLLVEVCCFRTGRGDRRQSHLSPGSCCWLQNLNNNTTRSTPILDEDLEMVEDKKVWVVDVGVGATGGGGGEAAGCEIVKKEFGTISKL